MGDRGVVRQFEGPFLEDGNLRLDIDIDIVRGRDQEEIRQEIILVDVRPLHDTRDDLLLHDTRDDLPLHDARDALFLLVILVQGGKKNIITNERRNERKTLDRLVFVDTLLRRLLVILVDLSGRKEIPGTVSEMEDERVVQSIRIIEREMVECRVEETERGRGGEGMIRRRTKEDDLRVSIHEVLDDQDHDHHLLLHEFDDPPLDPLANRRPWNLDERTASLDIRRPILLVILPSHLPPIKLHHHLHDTNSKPMILESSNLINSCPPRRLISPIPTRRFHSPTRPSLYDTALEHRPSPFIPLEEPKIVRQNMGRRGRSRLTSTSEMAKICVAGGEMR